MTAAGRVFRTCRADPEDNGNPLIFTYFKVFFDAECSTDGGGTAIRHSILMLLYCVIFSLTAGRFTTKFVITGLM